jgi:hypothetical protein
LEKNRIILDDATGKPSRLSFSINVVKALVSPQWGEGGLRVQKRA